MCVAAEVTPSKCIFFPDTDIANMHVSHSYSGGSKRRAEDSTPYRCRVVGRAVLSAPQVLVYFPRQAPKASVMLGGYEALCIQYLECLRGIGNPHDHQAFFCVRRSSAIA